MNPLAPIKKLSSFFKSLFLSGLFTLMPIILTIFIIISTYEILARWLAPLRALAPIHIRQIPGSEFVIVTLFVMFVGILLHFLILSPIIHWLEHLITKIPFIRTVYSSSKTLVDFFNIPNPATAKRKVVLIEFPRKGAYNIAFLLEEATDSFTKLIPAEKLNSGKIYYKIFMPNSPNPTSGYFLVLSEDEIIPTTMTFEEAIRTIVSCGLITPDSLKRL